MHHHTSIVAATTWRCISNTEAVWCVKDFHGHHEKQSLQYTFQLEPGNLLTFDNHRLMHARTAYTGLRQMCGYYINKEDWVSKLRMLRKVYSD